MLFGHLESCNFCPATKRQGFHLKKIQTYVKSWRCILQFLHQGNVPHRSTENHILYVLYPEEHISSVALTGADIFIPFCFQKSCHNEFIVNKFFIIKRKKSTLGK